MSDRPQQEAAFPSRGFMLDSARCLESRQYYHHFVDFAAERGIEFLLWHFTDDQGCSLQFDCVPGIASPNAYSKSEMRQLVHYASERGIELIPELASLGHCRYLTRLPEFSHLNEADEHFTGMCPVSRETRRIIRLLIEETAGIFPSRNFHVGLDEVNIGQHPLTRAAMETHTRGDLLADYCMFLHGTITRLGRRMWMWGDGLLKHREMMDRLPRDIVVCNWQYRPDVSPDMTQAFLDAGFEVMLCSALISHDQMLFPGRQFAVPNIRTLESQRSLTGTRRVLGHLTAIWTPVRFIADSLWLGVDLAAAILNHGPDVDAAAVAAAFAQSFYGLSGASVYTFAEVADLLFEHAPLRKEWRTVAKLEPLSAPMLDHVRTAGRTWSQAQAQLENLSPTVRKHDTEFHAFELLINVLAHTYDVAVCMACGTTDADAIAMRVRHGEAIVHRVEQAWDHERFADDPRKYTAPVASFQDDHLIPLLQTGLAVFKNKLDKPGVSAILSDEPGSIAPIRICDV